ncbi:MAG: tRNA preQ1(34) S-adenosylmethionine ribosyltransferase-isomerase QueA [Phycisphaerales bacterium]
MRTSELDYDLPPELIATRACEPRDAARLLVCSRTDPSRLEHRAVHDLPGLLTPGDTLVFNTSRVIPARLIGRNLDTGGGVEGLYLRDASPAEGGAIVWEALIKARRFRPGRRITLLDAGERPVGVTLTLIERTGEEPGAWRVEVACETPGLSTIEILERAGRTPLPPYIRSARRASGLEVSDADDRARYQTVYASASGSIAAPTAGLHFTPGLLDQLAVRGVRRADVTLHVGPGTFKPVETETLEEHPMHAEWCSMDERAIGAVFGGQTEEAGWNPAAPGGGRVVAVGSTAARTIESYAAVLERGGPASASLETDLLIAPGYRWRRVDAILTNFHLPRSTLLAMIAALFPEGMDRVRAIYAEAIREGYRFYSYGDAMLALP